MAATKPTTVDPKARAFAEASRDVRVWAAAVKRLHGEAAVASEESSVARGKALKAAEAHMIACERLRLAQQRFEDILAAWRQDNPIAEEDEDDAKRSA